MIIAIDGPSGAGKTSVSTEVARRLGVDLLDTGALYRGAALLAVEAGIDPTDGAAVAERMRACEFSFRRVEGALRLFADDRDVSAEIRSPNISTAASMTSAQPEVRAALLDLQRRLGRLRDCVVEGRDIGTVVFPDAEHKFFLTASVHERVRRRQLEYQKRGREISAEDLHAAVEARDARDSERAIAPMTPAVDAVLLDSTELAFEAVVEVIVQRVTATVPTT